MILEYLVKRSPRERLAWGLTALLVVLLVSYLAGIGPALRSLDGIRQDVRTTHSSLELQQRQLRVLQAETEAGHKTLERLKDIPCPWVTADKADALLQQWQKEAEDLGLTVRSVIRERQAGFGPKDAAVQVSTLLVRMNVHGPYASVMTLLAHLGGGQTAVGIEDMVIKGLDEEPYDVEVSLLVRLPVVEGESHA